jgi:hypothetical protein
VVSIIPKRTPSCPAFSLRTFLEALIAIQLFVWTACCGKVAGLGSPTEVAKNTPWVQLRLRCGRAESNDIPPDYWRAFLRAPKPRMEAKAFGLKALVIDSYMLSPVSGIRDMMVSSPHISLFEFWGNRWDVCRGVVEKRTHLHVKQPNLAFDLNTRFLIVIFGTFGWSC